MNDEEKQALSDFFTILLDVQIGVWKNRLEKEPDGFPLDGLSECRRCKTETVHGWYTRHGIVCEECKKTLRGD